MNSEPPVDPAIRRRNRTILVALALLFGVPFLAAGVLTLLDWRPAHTSNHGILLDPPVKLSDLSLYQADGRPYAFAPQERRWQLAVVPTPDCGQSCVDLIAALDKVWRLQGRRADRLQLLWFGPVPAAATPFRTLVPMRPEAALEERLPGLAASGAPSLYLIDSFGFLVMQYAPGVDAADLRADIAKVLK